jgi:hypothetical protein
LELTADFLILADGSLGSFFLEDEDSSLLLSKTTSSTFGNSSEGRIVKAIRAALAASKLLIGPRLLKKTICLSLKNFWFRQKNFTQGLDAKDFCPGVC